MPTFTISEMAKKTGLSPDTLRYYEKIGLISSPNRGAGGIRYYEEVEYERIRFLLYLKNTQMPLKSILSYVRAYAKGDETECYRLLDEHRINIESKIKEMKEVLGLIKFKLEHFQEVKDGKRTL